MTRGRGDTPDAKREVSQDRCHLVKVFERVGAEEVRIVDIQIRDSCIFIDSILKRSHF
jgi:cyanophycinase-like exopeptidase